MLKVYGSMLCKDCVECREAFDKAGISYRSLDFSDELIYLKEFLSLRDQQDVFAAVRAEGRIGIPCIVDDEGNLTLDWEQYLASM